MGNAIETTSEDSVDDVWLPDPDTSISSSPTLTPINNPTTQSVGLQPEIKTQPFFQQLDTKMLGTQIPHNFQNQFLFTYHNASTHQNILLKCNTYLDKGGFGYVFVASEVLINNQEGNVFVVKIPFKSGDKELERLAARHNAGNSWIDGSQHPNVVTVMGWSNTDNDEAGEPFLAPGMKNLAPFGFVVLEYGHLGDILTQYVMCAGGTERETTWPEKHLKRLARDLLLGIAFMHKHGIVHRDIKAENLVIDCYGNVKLTDWGLILPTVSKKDRMELADPRTELVGKGKGTTGFMAPEMCVNPRVVSSNINPNEYADIWSCGCTLLLCATACPPSQLYLGGTKFQEVNFAKQCVLSEKNHDAVKFWKTWWNSWLKEGPSKGDFVQPSTELEDFLNQIFVIQFPSKRNNTEGSNLRASAEELLKHPWLENVSSDQEWAELFVQRNYRKTLTCCTKHCPKHSKLLSTSTNGKFQGAFFACLVGSVYKEAFERSQQNINSVKVHDFLDTLGLGRIEIDSSITFLDVLTKVDWCESIESQLQSGEIHLLSLALKSLGLTSKWIEEKSTEEWLQANNGEIKNGETKN